MTLTITLDLSPLEEQALRQGIADHNSEIVRRLLLEALEPTVSDLLSYSDKSTNEQRWQELTTQMHEIVAAALPKDFKGLSDYAVSREGIYAEHP